MGEWSQKTICDLYRLRARIGWQGLKAHEFLDDGPYLITGTNFHDGKISWDECYHISEARYNQDTGIQIHENDLLITKDGTIGKTAVATNCPPQAALNSGVFVLHQLNRELNSKYLYYVLNSHVFELFMRNILTGSTIKHLNQEHFYKFSFTYPKQKSEQEKIAQILATVDEVIGKTKAIIEKYKAIKEGLMQDLLVNGIDENGVIRSPKTHKYKDSPLGKIPVEWECVELIEWSTKHSDSIVDGPFGSNLKLVHYRSSGIPVIQSGYVTSGHFVANNYVYVDMEKFREQYRCRVNPKDIVMAKIGANCGRSAVLPENHPQSIIAGNSLKITVNKQYVPELLHEFLEYYYAQGKFELIKAVTAQPAISLSNLKKMKIVLMSAPEQKRIWEKIDAINKMIMEEKIIYHKLLSTKTGLMQDLLTHKVPVDPLLKRSVENE